MDDADLITIAARHAGPPGMGHGGYVAGVVGRRWPTGVEVTLRRPVPIETPLRLDETEVDRSTLWHGEELIAEAVPAELDLAVPPAPSRAEAAAAELGSPSHHEGRGVHPTCFGCGLARPDGDGLRIAAGPVPGDDALVAAVWTPGPEVAGPDGATDPTIVVAALDCPGAFAFLAAGEPAGLLGRITVRLDAPVPAAEEHIVTGWRVGVDGKKLLAGTALLSAEGELLAAARAVWFPWPGR
jgi:hypothetical protein